MTTIVFASCMHVGADRRQPVWDEAAAHRPDWLILCGDNMYMDYGVLLYQPRYWSLQKFATKMYERYAAQFNSGTFRKLVQSIPPGQVVGVWDDHDFAWNNCCGAETDFEMPGKRLIARAMFHNYFEALNKRPLEPKLPTISFEGLPNLPGSNRDIYRDLDIDGLRVLLCDGRSYREDKKGNSPNGQLLGTAQEEWLLDHIKAAQKPCMIVSGSTMTDAEDQSWDYFSDFYNNRFLRAVEGKLVIFLSGDIHRNLLPPGIAGSPIEIVSSNAGLSARDPARNFGVLELSLTEMKIYLYHYGSIQYSGHIDLTKQQFKTSVTNLAARPVDAEDVRRANQEKHRAMSKLLRRD